MHYLIRTVKKNLHPLYLDFLGFSASMLCVIHCVAFPFLLSLAPVAGFQILSDPAIEYAVIIFGLIIAGLSILHGYGHHRKKAAFYTVATGFILIILGHLLHSHEAQEIYLTVIGAIIVAAAHFINWQQVQRAKKKLSHASSRKSGGSRQHSKAAYSLIFGTLPYYTL